MSVNSINIPINVDNSKKLINFMKNDVRKHVDNLLLKMMLFRGKPFSMSEEVYTQEDIDRELRSIYEETSIDDKKVKQFNLEEEVDSSQFTLEKFKEELAHFAGIFTGEVPFKVEKREKGKKDKKTKLKYPANVYKMILFANSNSVYKGAMLKKTPYLLCSNLFPIASDFECKALSRSIIAEVSRKLSSFQEINKMREDEKAEVWKEAENSDKLDKDLVKACLDFLQDMVENDEYFETFSKSNFQSIVKFFRSNVEYLRKINEEHGDDFRFTSDADLSGYKIITGYSYKFINYLYSEYKVLWQEHDCIENTYKDKKGKKVFNCVMTDNAYIKILKELFKYAFHPYVNISRFEDTGKLPCLLFGKNYIKYKLERIDNDHVFLFVNPMGGKTKLSGKLIANGYLNNLKIVNSDDSNQKYRISFNNSKESEHSEVLQTTYFGSVKEPKLRYDVDREQFYLDLSISQIDSSRDVIRNHPDVKKLINEKNEEDSEFKFLNQYLGFKDKFVKNLCNYFNTSYAKGKMNQAKSTLELDDFNIMGVDLGINPLLSLAVYNVKKDPNGIDNGQDTLRYELVTTHMAKQHDLESIKKIEKVNRLVQSVRILISHTNKHLRAIENKKNGRRTYEVDIPFAKLNYEHVLKESSEFNSVEEYLTYVKNNLQGVDPKQWKKKSFNWVVGKLINVVKKEFKKIRSAYGDSEDKAKYVREENFVSTKNMRKIELTRNLISLLNSYTFLGMTDEEREGFNKNHKPCSDLWDYLTGLRSFLSKNMASIIIHHALKNNVNVIFLEDLDHKANFMDNKEENRLKSVWGASDMIKYLESFASKHSIAICKVDPTLTSQIDAETNELGYRDEKNKSDLYVRRDSEIVVIDSDINAAKNIAIRGLNRHSSLPLFRTVQINDSTYAMSFSNMAEDRRRQGSMMNYLGKDKQSEIKYIIFGKNEDHLDINTTTASEFNKKIKESERKAKRVEVIRSGDKFYMRGDLDKIVKSFNNK